MSLIRKKINTFNNIHSIKITAVLLIIIIKKEAARKKNKIKKVLIIIINNNTTRIIIIIINHYFYLAHNKHSNKERTVVFFLPASTVGATCLKQASLLGTPKINPCCTNAYADKHVELCPVFFYCYLAIRRLGFLFLAATPRYLPLQK